MFDTPFSLFMVIVLLCMYGAVFLFSPLYAVYYQENIRLVLAHYLKKSFGEPIAQWTFHDALEVVSLRSFP